MNLWIQAYVQFKDEGIRVFITNLAQQKIDKELFGEYASNLSCMKILNVFPSLNFLIAPLIIQNYLLFQK